jgi:hypothetical protein
MNEVSKRDFSEPGGPGGWPTLDPPLPLPLPLRLASRLCYADHDTSSYYDSRDESMTKPRAGQSWDVLMKVCPTLSPPCLTSLTRRQTCSCSSSGTVESVRISILRSSFNLADTPLTVPQASPPCCTGTTKMSTYHGSSRRSASTSASRRSR